MGKAVVFIIIFLVLAGTLTFLYFHYEKPVQKEDVVQYTNLTIFAKDNKGELIKTGYTIFLNGSLYAAGETDKYTGIREVVSVGNEFVIKNVNLPEQSYYIKKIDFFSTIPNKVNRIDLDLEKVGELNITKKGNFITDNKITLILTTNNSFKDLMYCLKWSEMLVYVQSANDIMSADTFDNNYKCYETTFNLNEKNNYVISINYNSINILTPDDYIMFSFYDKDEVLGSNYTKRQEYYVK
jgi:hypothetical protein